MNGRLLDGEREREREKLFLSPRVHLCLLLRHFLPHSLLLGVLEREAFFVMLRNRNIAAKLLPFAGWFVFSLKKCARKKAIGLFLLASTLVLVSPSLPYSLSFRGGRAGRKGRRFPPPPILQNRRRGREEKTKGLNFTS